MSRGVLDVLIRVVARWLVLGLSVFVSNPARIGYAQEPELSASAPGFAANSRDDLLATFRAEASQWEDEIAALERTISDESISSESVLFIGSSSIRLWDSIRDDMAPIPVVRLGFGGAKFSDLAVHLRRIVPTRPVRAVVIFAANDIRGEADDRSPDDVVRIFSNIAEQLNDVQPNARVFLIAITPTRARWSAWPKIREANAALQSLCEASKNCQFIRTEDLFLNAESLPREELFQEDRLHLNREGYKLWSGRIREYLNRSANDGALERKAG